MPPYGVRFLPERRATTGRLRTDKNNIRRGVGFPSRCAEFPSRIPAAHSMSLPCVRGGATGKIRVHSEKTTDFLQKTPLFTLRLTGGALSCIIKSQNQLYDTEKRARYELSLQTPGG